MILYFILSLIFLSSCLLVSCCLQYLITLNSCPPRILQCINNISPEQLSLELTFFFLSLSSHNIKPDYTIMKPYFYQSVQVSQVNTKVCLQQRHSSWSDRVITLQLNNLNRLKVNVFVRSWKKHSQKKINLHFWTAYTCYLLCAVVKRKQRFPGNLCFLEKRCDTQEMAHIAKATGTSVP